MTSNDYSADPVLNFVAFRIVVQKIYISTGHSYWTKRDEPKLQHEMQSVGEVEAVAGRGLTGDRYFNGKFGHKGQITLIDGDVIDALALEFRLTDLDASLLRRNLVVRGCDLSQLFHKTFRVGDAICEGVQECKPCEWMDRVVAVGAKAFLSTDFRGGLRCRIIQSGTIRTD